MLYSSPLKLDLQADVISPINVAQRFGILPAVGLVNNRYVSAALTEQIAIQAQFLASSSRPGPGPGAHMRPNSGRRL